MIVESLNPSYSSTVFRASAPAGGWPERFAVLTAWNPSGQDASPEQNQRLDESLAQRLKTLGVRAWRMNGGSPDWSHQEAGYGVESDQQTALDLGKEFQQEAIFWVEDGELLLVACEDASTKKLGPWKARLRAD